MHVKLTCVYAVGGKEGNRQDEDRESSTLHHAERVLMASLCGKRCSTELLGNVLRKFLFGLELSFVFQGRRLLMSASSSISNLLESLSTSLEEKSPD